MGRLRRLRAVMLTRTPGPRSLLNYWLLGVISQGFDELRFRRIQDGYEMWGVAKGVRQDMVLSLPGYVRRFADVLWRHAHGRPGLVRWVGRSVRRLGTVTERGEFDLPVGPVFVVSVSYRVGWRQGRVDELVIALGDFAALLESGIVQVECELAYWRLASG